MWGRPLCAPRPDGSHAHVLTEDVALHIDERGLDLQNGAASGLVVSMGDLKARNPMSRSLSLPMKYCIPFGSKASRELP